MICAVCREELEPILAWYECGCGCSFAIQAVDHDLDLWCPAGHVYEPRDPDG